MYFLMCHVSVFRPPFFGGYPQFACMYILVPYLFYSVSILCVCVYLLITFLRPPFLRREHKRYNYPYVNYCYSGLRTCLSVNTCALLILFCIVLKLLVYIFCSCCHSLCRLFCVPYKPLGSFLFLLCREHDVLHVYYL